MSGVGLFACVVHFKPGELARFHLIGKQRDSFNAPTNYDDASRRIIGGPIAANRGFHAPGKRETRQAIRR